MGILWRWQGRQKRGPGDRARMPSGSETVGLGAVGGETGQLKPVRLARGAFARACLHPRSAGPALAAIGLGASFCVPASMTGRRVLGENCGHAS